MIAEDAALLAGAGSIDVVVEATGIPEAGAANAARGHRRRQAPRDGQHRDRRDHRNPAQGEGRTGPGWCTPWSTAISPGASCTWWSGRAPSVSRSSLPAGGTIYRQGGPRGDPRFGGGPLPFRRGDPVAAPHQPQDVQLLPGRDQGAARDDGAGQHDRTAPGRARHARALLQPRRHPAPLQPDRGRRAAAPARGRRARQQRRRRRRHHAAGPAADGGVRRDPGRPPLHPRGPDRLRLPARR